jgi:hypothetical protein
MRGEVERRKVRTENIRAKEWLGFNWQSKFLGRGSLGFDFNGLCSEVQGWERNQFALNPEPGQYRQ